MENIIESHKIKIKHNELCDKENNVWLANIDGKDYYFSEIEINVFSQTLESENTFYISCSGWIQVINDRLIINPFQSEEDIVLN